MRSSAFTGSVGDVLSMFCSDGFSLLGADDGGGRALTGLAFVEFSAPFALRPRDVGRMEMGFPRFIIIVANNGKWVDANEPFSAAFGAVFIPHRAKNVR